MKQAIENLYEFVQNVKTKSFVKIDSIEIEALEKFSELNGDYSQDPSIDSYVEFAKELRNINLEGDKKSFYYLNINLNWRRITWGLHTRTRLDKELAGLQFVPNAKYDRLDLIREYLEQCVKLLPGTFPFLNLQHHGNYYKRFQELYESSRV